MAVNFQIMKPTALLCNILVATGGTLFYYKENLIDLKKNWPFLAAGVPCAFIGGFWPVKENTFFQIIKAGFAHKRKVLRKNLEEININLKKIDEIFQKLEINEKSRAEDIKFDKWIKINELFSVKD